ncbi:MAG: hypothetical protein WAT19_02305 [Ferruginibacter sp.]
MLNRAHIATAISTTYLLIYAALLQSGHAFTLALAMFAGSPFVIAWMAYCILKFGNYNGPQLGNDEWGYQDIPDKSLLN